MATIEDIYDEIGGLGWYQVVIILTIVSSQITAGWSMIQMAFAGVIPDFECRVPCADSSSSSSSSSFSSFPSTMSCDSEGYQILNGTRNKCSFNGSKCEYFNYDTDSDTVIVQWGLICDLEWAKRVIISVQMAGVLVGTLLAGQLSDMFGRKKVLAGFVLSHLLIGIGASFSVSWIMFACMRFLAGIGIGAIVVVVFPYVMEFLPLKWRPVAAIIPSFSLGVSIFAGMAYWLNSWRYLHIACGLVAIPTLIGLCCIPESIRWQAVHGKFEDAEKTLATIAKRNKKKLPQMTSAVLKSFSFQEKADSEKGRTYTYLDLFKSVWTAKISFIFWLYWFTMAVAYYGIAFGVTSLSGNLYLNIFLMGVIEIPIQVTTFFLNNRFGRKRTTLFFFVMTLIPSVGCLILQLFAKGSLRSVGINVFSQLAKTMVGCLWSCVQLWGNELFPTVIRNLGAGFSCLGARVGGIIAPFIINLDQMPAVSYAILSGLLLVDAILVVFLQETRGKALQETLEQQEFGTCAADQKNGSCGGAVVVEGGEDKEEESVRLTALAREAAV